VPSGRQDFGEWLLPLFFQVTDFVAQCKNPTTRNIWTNNLFQQQARYKQGAYHMTKIYANRYCSAEPHYTKLGGNTTRCHSEKLVSGTEFGPGPSFTSDVSQPARQQITVHKKKKHEQHKHRQHSYTERCTRMLNYSLHAQYTKCFRLFGNLAPLDL